MGFWSSPGVLSKEKCEKVYIISTTYKRERGQSKMICPNEKEYALALLSQHTAPSHAIQHYLRICLALPVSRTRRTTINGGPGFPMIAITRIIIHSITCKIVLLNTTNDADVLFSPHTQNCLILSPLWLLTAHKENGVCVFCDEITSVNGVPRLQGIFFFNFFDWQTCASTLLKVRQQFELS